MLYTYTDVIHPESGEVLAEDGDVFNEEMPRARHVLAIAETYPDHYFIYIDKDMTAIADGSTEF